MVHLAGGTAVVTGAASGIGAALAEALAAEGSNIALVDVDDRVEAVRDRVVATGVEAIALRADVSNRHEVLALRDVVLQAFGSVTVLCNNAGVMGPNGDPLWELPFEEWERVVAVNVWGVLHGIQAFLPAMLAGGGRAHVVNTASMQGLTSGTLIPEYTLSKHAVVALSESLRAQLAARGAPISVHVLCPGGVDSGLAETERRRLAPCGDDWATAPAVGAGAALLAPADVAAAALAGIRADRFYVFTHPGSRERVAARVEEIMSSFDGSGRYSG